MIRGMKMYLGIAGVAGLFCAIKAKVSNSTALLKVNRKDCKHSFWLRTPSSDISTYKQIFINQEYKFLIEKQPKVIVDAGANIGLASIYFANKYPGAKIIAIEPEQSNFELLNKNVASYDNIVPVQAALWHKNEEINLFDPGLGKWGFMTEEQDASENISDNVSHLVTAMTVDKIMDDHKLDKIDILKIDIEGAEKEVFSNTSSWVDKIDAIIVELHDHMKSGCSRSFYNGSNGFDDEWRQGENVYLTRTKCLARCTT